MNAKAAVAQSDRHELAGLRKEWWCFLLLGFLFLLCGVGAIVFPFMATAGVTIFIGAALIVAGVASMIGSFWAGKWSGFFLQLLVGIFYAVVGWAIVDSTGTAVAESARAISQGSGEVTAGPAIDVITLLLAAFFVVVGIFRIVVSLSEKFPQWGWALVSGILTTLVGLIIYKTYPVSAFWVIGVLVGVELIFNGWYWLMLAMALKNLPEDA